jgi:hypothetical protein
MAGCIFLFVTGREPAGENTMTYRDAVRVFRREYLPLVEQKYPGDTPARRLAWCEYTDMLHRDRLITDMQADRWKNPF